MVKMTDQPMYGRRAYVIVGVNKKDPTDIIGYCENSFSMGWTKHWVNVWANHGKAIAKENAEEYNVKKFCELYEKGDNNLIIRLPQLTAVRDTLFNKRPDFKVEDLRYIPFAEGDTVIMRTIVKQVSGVDVPLFEAQMPYWSLLKGMDRQQIVNLVSEREDTDRYPGLMVGSIDNANNNAGNWE